MGMEVEPDELEINERIESFIIELGLPFEEVEQGLWLIHDEIDYIDNIVVYHTPPVLTFRVKLVDVKDGQVQPRLYRRLLQLNASSMVAGAFGLEDESVVIVESLQSENLNQNEFQAAIDSIALAVREHYDDLRSVIKGDSNDDESDKEAVQAADRV